MLGDRARESLQSPSNPKEKKGLKEVQYATHVHCAARPHPPNPWGNLRLARGPSAGTLDKRLTFPLRSRVVSLPSRERTDSASLEGREPTLGGADPLRLARGHPSTERISGPSEPPRTRGAISASLEGSPSRPSTAPRVSASLEGSEPTLEQTDRLRLARGHPSTERTKRPSVHPPAVWRH